MVIKRPVLNGITTKIEEKPPVSVENPPLSEGNPLVSEEKVEVPPQYLDFFTRISDRVGTTNVVGAMADWICKNTYLDDENYSFLNHEYALDIANDTSPDGVIVKCSQVGLTELAVRISLGLLAVSNNLSLIYVLPSAAFASEFGKTRVNPVVEGSPKLTSMLVTSSNSAKMKRIGSGILYVGGAASKKQAISRPAQALIIDEYDFCDMAVLTSYNGRLRHILAPRKPFKRKFSTPTVKGYGIDKEYTYSTQKRYMVKCRRCNHWHAPDFRTEVVIPGWKGEDFRTFSRDDLVDERYQIDKAYIRCIRCGRELDSSLAMPEQREWVARFPQRTVTGWSVRPYDLIKYNTTLSVIKQMDEYYLDSDYWNFVHGETYESDVNQINIDTVKKMMLVSNQPGSGCYMGVDVGAKFCHVMIGKRIEGKVHVLKAVKLTAPGFIKQVVDLYEEYDCDGGVIDAQPDATLGQEIIEELGKNFRQCYYIKGEPKAKEYFEIHKETNIINCARTRGIDSLVQDINKELWLFPTGDLIMEKEVIPHFGGMKRVDQIDDIGEKVPRWVKIGQDHFMHAAMYLKISMDIDDKPGSGSSHIIMAPPGVMGANVGGKIKVIEGSEARRVLAMFGVR